MARICAICGKKPSTGNNVSHAHNKSKRRWLPNLQRVKVLQERTVKTIQVCTSCIRSGKITKAPHGGTRPKPAAGNAT